MNVHKRFIFVGKHVGVSDIMLNEMMTQFPNRAITSAPVVDWERTDEYPMRASEYDENHIKMSHLRWRR